MEARSRNHLRLDCSCQARIQLRVQLRLLLLRHCRGGCGARQAIDASCGTILPGQQRLQLPHRQASQACGLHESSLHLRQNNSRVRVDCTTRLSLCRCRLSSTCSSQRP